MKKLLFVILVILMASFVVQAQDGAELPVTESGPEVLVPEIIDPEEVKIKNKIVVLVTGHTGTFDYDGNEQSVEGYEFEIKCDENPEVDLSDFHFALKDGFEAVVRRTNPTNGPVGMGVNKDYFDYNREKFVNVEIRVEDGWIEINENEAWHKVLYPELYEPVVEEPVEEPVVEEPVEEPVVEEPVEEPVIEEPVEEPVVEEPVEKPVAEEPVKEPAAQEPAEKPAAEVTPEVTVLDPVVEAEAPKAENVPAETATVIVPEVVDEPEATPEPTEVDNHVYDTVVVSIKGKQAIVDYDGQKHTVEGYEVTDISNSEYTENDFMFIGNDYAELTEPGFQPMGLIKEMFGNKNDRFVDVEFVITDGFIEVSPSNYGVDEDTEELTDGEELTEGEGAPAEGEEPTEGEATPTAEGEEPTEGEATPTAEDEELTEGEVTPTAEGEEPTEGEVISSEENETDRIIVLPAETVVYGEPDVESEIFITLQDPAEVTVLSVDDLGWAELQFEDETKGYVILSEVLNTEAEPETSEEPVTVTVPAGVVLRSEADGMSVIEYTFDEETEVTVLENADGFVKVQIGEVVGYIYTGDIPAAKENGENTGSAAAENAAGDRKVRIFTNRRAVVELGETIELTSVLENFQENDVVTYQWECDKGSGFEDIPGANADTYSYQANEENLTWKWRLTVFF